jgi:DNA (cytosine-5)-methyltransferase 1
MLLRFQFACPVTPFHSLFLARRLRNSDGTFTGNQRTHHTADVVKRFRKLRPLEVDPVGRYPRLSWNNQCPALRAGTGADHGSHQAVRPIHPTEPRVITVREAARLQGFSDGFWFHPTIWHSFRMIGNSVSPMISQTLFSLIASRIGLHEAFKTAAE